MGSAGAKYIGTIATTAPSYTVTNHFPEAVDVCQSDPAGPRKTNPPINETGKWGQRHDCKEKYASQPGLYMINK